MNEAFCALGKTGRTGLQKVRDFQEKILWTQFLASSHTQKSTNILNRDLWSSWLAASLYRDVCLTARTHLTKTIQSVKEYILAELPGSVQRISQARIQKEKQLLYTNTHTRNLERWHWWNDLWGIMETQTLRADSCTQLGWGEEWEDGRYGGVNMETYTTICR